MSDIYAIVYSSDEINLKVSECKQPGFCSCKISKGPKCGYPVEEAKQIIVDYYRKRADYIENLSDEDFLYESAFIYP